MSPIRRSLKLSKMRDEWYSMNKLKKREESIWYVYILECADGTYYTGITTDVNRRLKEHNKGKKAAKYTRSRRPLKLLASTQVPTRSEALKLEITVKKLYKKEKVDFIKNYKHGE